MLIIGIGNPDRGDDAAGILVGRRLKEQGIDALEFGGTALDLIDLWESATRTVVIDAMLSGGAPGEVRVWDTPIMAFPKGSFCCSTHSIDLAAIIELARVLDRLPKKLTIYGIAAAQFTPGTPPSPEVLTAVKSVADQIFRMEIPA